MKSVSLSASWAEFHAHVNPLFAAWTFLTYQSAAIRTIEKRASFLSTFWAFRHCKTPIPS